MNSGTDSERRKAVVSLLTALLFFSSVPVFLKHFAQILDGWTVNGVRYTMAAVFWIPYVYLNHRRSPEGRSVWRDALPPSLVNICGQTGWALSPYHNDATVMGFVGRCSFLFTILFGFLLLREERVLAKRAGFWAGAVTIMAGLYMLYRGSAAAGRTSPLGIGILLGTATCWGLYSVFVKKFMKGYPVRLSFGVISLYTTAGLLVIMFAAGDWKSLETVTPVNWTLLAVAAMVGIAWGHVFMYKAIQHLGPIVAEGGLLLIPFVTTLGAFFFLGEHMNTLQWSGGVVMIAGAMGLVLTKGRVLSLLLMRTRVGFSPENAN